MRLVYVNLHDNGFFVQRMRNFLVRRKDITKHDFLLRWMIKNNVEIINYITPSCNLFPTRFLRITLKGRVLQKIMARFVFWVNCISNKSVKSVTDIAELRSNDIVIYYGTFDETQYDTINQIEGIKVIDHIHFYGNKEKAEKLRDKGFQYYFYEVNLKKYSKLYQENYSWFNGGYIERPYAYEDRFENRIDFAHRKNKAMAIGTLTKCPFPELINTYGEYYQPRRKMILDHAIDLSDILDSYISEYQEIE